MGEREMSQNKSLQSKMPLAMGLAFVAFTTQFGGGFASGAQIYQYFINYGIWCLILPAVTQGLYALFFWYGMRYAYKHKTYDYRSFSDSLYGKTKPVMSNLYEICYLIMIGTASAAAFATGGSTLQTLFGIPYWLCTLIIAAFIGSMLSIGFILLLARKIRNMATLLVGGIMIGYICSAVTDFVVTFAEDSDIVNLHGWSQGSFSGMSWSNVKVAALMVGITLILTFFLSKPIGAYQLGEMYAQSMGVNIRVFRVLLILLSSVFSACVTAFAGPISFVGIAVPYLIKHLLGTAKPLVVIPATFLGGAVFCMGCDLIARMAFAPLELNISTVTSIFGAPIVIFMMIKGRKGK